MRLVPVFLLLTLLSMGLGPERALAQPEAPAEAVPGRAECNGLFLMLDTGWSLSLSRDWAPRIGYGALPQHAFVDSAAIDFEAVYDTVLAYLHDDSAGPEPAVGDHRFHVVFRTPGATGGRVHVLSAAGRPAFMALFRQAYRHVVPAPHPIYRSDTILEIWSRAPFLDG